MDVANSALDSSHVLLGECVTACLLRHQPLLGILHSPDDHRHSLALDVLEEFRPYMLARRCSSRDLHQEFVTTIRRFLIAC